MLSVTFFACLSLSLLGAGCSLSCGWMEHKFKQYSEKSLNLLDEMASGDAAVEEAVTFPGHLYRQTSSASAERKLAFAVQILKEIAEVFEEDCSSASWEESTGNRFVGIVTQQADGLYSCIGSVNRNPMLHMYFKSLSRHAQQSLGHSAAAWELIRREIKIHLMRTDLLVSSLLTNN